MPNTFPIQEWPVLESLLRCCSDHPTHATPFGATADYCDDQNGPLDSLAWLLRYLAAHPRHILFTGSRRYGTPKPDSDFDWVIQLPGSDERWCAQHADEVKGAAATGIDGANDWEHDYFRGAGRLAEVSPYAGSLLLETTLRFGPVNLLVVNNTDQLGAWTRGTAQLVTEAPVTRDRAVEVFQAEWRAVEDRWRADAAEYRMAEAEYEQELSRYRRGRSGWAYSRHLGEV